MVVVIIVAIAFKKMPLYYGWRRSMDDGGTGDVVRRTNSICEYIQSKDCLSLSFSLSPGSKVIGKKGKIRVFEFLVVDKHICLRSYDRQGLPNSF